MTERIPAQARTLIDTHEPRISPLASLELQYMHEIGRARDPVPMMLAALGKGLGLKVHDVSLAGLVHTAMGLTWTRDPFDRLIAAHAIAADAPLVTADRTILENLSLATWD